MIPEEKLHEAKEQIDAVINEVQQVVVGQSRLVRNLFVALLAK